MNAWGDPQPLTGKVVEGPEAAAPPKNAPGLDREDFHHTVTPLRPARLSELQPERPVAGARNRDDMIRSVLERSGLPVDTNCTVKMERSQENPFTNVPGASAVRTSLSTSKMITLTHEPRSQKQTEKRVSRDAHRHSRFDTQLFSPNASSPAQAKQTLEAHLVETERRLEEVSKLGTALIVQETELEEKLREVKQQQDEDQIRPDLHQMLVYLKREYHEIGRETARALLGPKYLSKSWAAIQPLWPRTRNGL